MSITYDKRHSVTSILTAAVSAHRLVNFDGAPAGPSDDVQGISEESGLAGDAISLVTGYSYPAEAAEAISAGQWVGPASDGTGRVAPGGAFARALTAASQAGQRVVVVPVVLSAAMRALLGGSSSASTYYVGDYAVANYVV